MPRGRKVLVFKNLRGCRKTHFLARTSTIFGADAHDPKGVRRNLSLCTEKACVAFLVPRCNCNTSPAATTLEICLERSFTRATANRLLHPRNSRKNAIVLRPLRTIASHEPIARKNCDRNNYCGNTPCGSHPFSELATLAEGSCRYRFISHDHWHEYESALQKNPQAHAQIGVPLSLSLYIYIYACCEVIIWAKFGVLIVIILAKHMSLSGPR